MRRSNFFADLCKSYQAEIEDHSTDSEGTDVLKAQLKKKRSQFAELLPMIEFAPEMVAIAFHEGIKFPFPKVLEKLVGQEPDDFMDWAELAQSISFTPWAQELADLALEEDGGQQFLMVTAGLEFLYSRHLFAQPEVSEVDPEQEDKGDQRDAEEYCEEPGEGEVVDLEQAGAEWMAEQGFDRLD